MTFSIVAWDEQAREWGVAVASKFLAVGSVVPWARAGTGALATQAQANLTYGPAGLELLDRHSAEEVVSMLTAGDDDRQHRQLAVVDRYGGSAAFTGSECFPWAGAVSGPGFSCQGNILTGPGVVDAMVSAFQDEEGGLADRLLAALHSGESAGGDKRGRQSASVLVVRDEGGYLGGSDVAVDLRVDDHSEPVEELSRLHSIHRLLFPDPSNRRFEPVDDDLAVELADALADLGYASGAVTYDGVLQRALSDWMGVENLEMRWADGPRIDAEVLARLLPGR